MSNVVGTSSVEMLLKRRQDEFIEKRTIIESEVTKFFESLGNLDADIKERINYDPTRNARTELSALWEEPFNMEKYSQQRQVLDQYIALVGSVCDMLNEEALRCLQES